MKIALLTFYGTCFYAKDYDTATVINYHNGHIEAIGYSKDGTILDTTKKEFGYIAYYNYKYSEYKLRVNIDGTCFSLCPPNSRLGYKFGSALSETFDGVYNSSARILKNLIVVLKNIRLSYTNYNLANAPSQVESMFLAESGVLIDYGQQLDYSLSCGLFFGNEYDDYIGNFLKIENTEDFLKYFAHYSTESISSYKESTKNEYQESPLFSKAFSFQKNTTSTSFTLNRIQMKNPTGKFIRICVIYNVKNFSSSSEEELTDRPSVHLKMYNDDSTQIDSYSMSSNKVVIKSENSEWRAVIVQIPVPEQADYFACSFDLNFVNSSNVAKIWSGTVNIAGFLIEYCN